MIKAECFGKDWVLKQKQQLGRFDPGILEKAIHALALLGHLAESGLPFVFKGGTSLLLHLSPIRRLSIDIDIICTAPAATLDATVASIAGLPPFKRFEESQRGERGLPRRRHFKFFYNSSVNGGRELPILLDVVEEENCVVEVVEKSIITPFIEVERDVRVTVPTIEALLGDKLTAFAPHTTGVPFEPDNGRDCETMQVVKQMFDVAELFGAISDLTAVARAYDAVQSLEAGYREQSFTRDETLRDTRDACVVLGKHGLKRVPEHPDAVKLSDGVGRLAGHLVQSRFNLDDAKVAAGKVGLLTTLLLKDRTDLDLASLRYAHATAMQALADARIEGDWERLNRLKGVNLEAFFYWHRAHEIDLI
jgi:predicted nucleotidyltransferase component of viral defense system